MKKYIIPSIYSIDIDFEADIIATSPATLNIGDGEDGDHGEAKSRVDFSTNYCIENDNEW